MKSVSILNGKKGGRPDGSKYVATFVIPDINLVILTEHQYNVLVKRYGLMLIKKALLILDEWLKTSPIGCRYKGKNNYAHFRADGWLINEAKSSIPQT